MKKLLKTILSTCLCFSLLFSFTIPASAQYQETEDFDISTFIEKAEVTSITDSEVVFSLKESVKTTSSMEKSSSAVIKTEYVSTSVTIITSSLEESKSIAHSPQSVMQRAGGSIETNETERLGLGSLWVSIHYSTSKYGDDTYIELDKVTGGYDLPMLQSGFSFKGSTVSYGQSGFAKDGGGIKSQSYNSLSGGKLFTKYPSSRWVPVGVLSCMVGASHTVKYEGRGRTYTTTAEARY